MVMLEKLIQSGLVLEANGDKLHIQAPKPLSQDQLDWLTQHKQQLLDELRNQPAANEPLALLHSAKDLDLPLLLDDQIFIDRLLEQRSGDSRHDLLSEYCEHWLAAAGAHDLKEHERDNAGRKAANTWLRMKMH